MDHHSLANHRPHNAHPTPASGSSSSASTTAADADAPPNRKRKRLSHACQACRARKVRCDESLPACRNCVRAQIQCITTDPRRPHLASVSRTRARSRSPHHAHASPASQPSSSSSSSQRQQQQQQQQQQPNANRHHLPRPPFDNHRRTSSHAAAAAAAQHFSTNTQLSASAASPASTHHTSPHSAAPDPNDLVGNALGGASTKLISDSLAQDRFKYLGPSNLQVFSRWIDLLLVRLNGSTARQPNALFQHFEHGRIHSEEHHPPSPLIAPLPALSPLRTFDDCLDDFLDGPNALFPILEPVSFRQEAHRAIRHLHLDRAAPRIDPISPYQIPLLASIYLVTALALLELPQPNDAERYLAAAYSLYGHIVGVPYLSSVQAMLLLHLTLRAKNKDGAAWQALGQAIRIAYSIGLHRAFHHHHLHPPAAAPPPPHAPHQVAPAASASSSSSSSSSSSGQRRRPSSQPLQPDHATAAVLDAFKARLWWCCYALDKVSTLDSGRPTMIHDGDVGLPLPQFRGPPPEGGGRGGADGGGGGSSSNYNNSNSHTSSDARGRDGSKAARRSAVRDQDANYFASLVALCRLQGEIHDALYTSHLGPHFGEADLFANLARLDQQLVDWHQDLVHAMGLPTGGGDEGVLGASTRRADLQVLFLLTLYHFTLISMHRASVMLDTALYRHHVTLHLPPPSHGRLVAAEAICKSSARSIIRLLSQYRSLYRSRSARQVSGTVPLAAVYVLAICVVKHPHDYTVVSDLGLIQSIGRTVEADYTNDGMPAGFTGIVGALTRLAERCIGMVGSREGSPAPGAYSHPNDFSGDVGRSTATAAATAATRDHSASSSCGAAAVHPMGGGVDGHAPLPHDGPPSAAAAAAPPPPPPMPPAPPLAAAGHAGSGDAGEGMMEGDLATSLPQVNLEPFWRSLGFGQVSQPLQYPPAYEGTPFAPHAPPPPPHLPDVVNGGGVGEGEGGGAGGMTTAGMPTMDDFWQLDLENPDDLVFATLGLPDLSAFLPPAPSTAAAATGTGTGQEEGQGR
ncbi:uncharacterized protein PSFLO_03834 [Pseudozyma flocculosa]|uniref:Zn(2)-C6 fungal-type domain-containing protein n=1 Tax=Pseudozyma flocculosa TaxID=84751 RepID=A0A5C3F3U9_9BASI|nr:uncharacterized protein PSFLO_03834 [Pseudozyma flocculosa]